MDAEHIAQVRRFNRLVTQRAGALNDHFLGRDRPLGQSRVLYEIGPDGAELRDIRARLGLDSGYLSRIVQSLGASGLLELDPADDERVRRARLTPAGLAEVAEMNERSDAAAEAVLAPLSPPQRERLVTAMAEVHTLLRAAGAAIEPIDPASAEALWCVEQYFAELQRRFPNGFDPANSIGAEDSKMRPPAGVFLVAFIDGEPVACGALKRTGNDSASIKRMWVASAARRLGLGRRLLGTLETHAHELGVRQLRLETNHSLTEATRLYRATGYAEVPPFNADPYADQWFEKHLED